MLQAARINGVRKFIYASSSSVYGDSPELPKTETMPVEPKSPYALSKYAGERYCQIFHELYGLDTVCLRYFNVFGPRQSGGSSYAAVIPAFVEGVLKGEPITIYGDGEQTRDFTYVDNVIRANILAIRSEKASGMVFNIACGKRLSVNSLAEMIMRLIGKESAIRYAERRKGDVTHSVADIRRAGDLLGYEPIVDVENGLRRFIEWKMSEDR